MFTGAAYPFVEDMAYQNTPFGHTEEGLMDVPMSYIDPSLQSPSPSAPYLSKWNPPQLVQRYLEDTQKTAFFNADVPSHMSASRGHMRPTVGIPPVPPPSQSARYTSPISSIEHSSSESSALSPPADTESHFDSNFPSTPPDTTLLSPYQHHSGFEHWNAPAHAIQFMSMGPTESFVNPIDVNPSQQLEYCENESAVNDFSLSSRGYSFESCNSAASQCDREPVIILGLRTKRMASPDELAPAVKEEIEAEAPQYPPLSKGGNHEDRESDEEPAPPILKRPNEDGDGEYQPDKRPKPNQRTPTRRAPRAKQATAASASPSRSMPSVSKKGSKPTRAASSANQQSTPKALPPTSSNVKGLFTCRKCPQQHFKDQATLDSHVKKQHTRAFICVFHFAGCDSTFASKNEWKRHVSSQHLLLHYWLCQEGICAKTCNTHPASTTAGSKSRARGGSTASNPTPSSAPNLPNGSIFNRKDLYTQHLRRMHTPPNIKKKQAAVKKSGGSSAVPSANVGNAGSASSNPSMLEWEEHLRNLQQRAIQERCRLPINMQCPARDCTQAFQGTDAWDQRMEHVAKHLEKAAVGKEDSVVFGGDNDPTLVQWASRPDVGIIKPAPAGRAGAWELNTPIRRGPGGATLVVAAAPVVITPTPMPAALLPVQPAAAGNAALHSDDEEEGEEEIVVTGEEMDEDDNEEEEEDDDDLRDGEGEEDDDGC